VAIGPNRPTTAGGPTNEIAGKRSFAACSRLPTIDRKRKGSFMITIRMWCIFVITAWMLLSVVGCSQSSAPTPTPKARAPAEEPLSAAELLKLYDPSSLVETKTLKSLPADLQSVLGVRGTDYDRIADVGVPCDPTDVVSKDYPTNCFFVGGISATSALVAYKVGGFAGQSGVGAAYVRTNLYWKKVASWDIGYPSNLKELREMTSFPPDDRSPVR
jgi:hypothetical protein